MYQYIFIRITHFAAPSISSFNPSNGVVGALITIFGFNFGSSSAPRKVYIGKSECINVVTVQDFQGLSCTLATGTGTNLSIVISVGGQIGSSSMFFTYSDPRVSSVERVQSPCTGLVKVNVFGFQFGDNRTLPKFSLGGTSQLVSFWLSSTSVVSKLPAGNQHSGISFIVQLSTESQRGSMSMPWMFLDPYVTVSTNTSNTPTTGSSAIQVSGSNFGSLYGATLRSKFGRSKSSMSACTASNWISDSSALCKQCSGISLALGISISVGSAASESTNFWTFDQPIQVNLLLFSNGPTTGSKYIEITNSGLGNQDYTARSQIGMNCKINIIDITTSSCERSVWV